MRLFRTATHATTALPRACFTVHRAMPTTPTHPIEIAAARAQWHPQGAYLNTASYGLPPDCGWEAMQAALADWRAGRTSWEHWGEATNAARDEFAALVRVPPETVATAATVSDLLGLVAASLPDGTRVLAPDIDFASVLFPFMAQEHRGVTVRLVAPEDIPDAIDARTDVVACHAYKWLMSPRGTAFMTVRPERLEAIVPVAAGWFAGADVHTSYFGPPLRLAETARRLDSSPAWFSWVGTQPALALVNAIGVEAIHDHDVGLANRFRAGLGLEPSDSAIVSADVPGARERLEAAGIVAAERGGRLRASWHVYNTEADVDAALDALAGT
jgi:selenocysteine lyase/cysteine desulfurase